MATESSSSSSSSTTSTTTTTSTTSTTNALEAQLAIQEKLTKSTNDYLKKVKESNKELEKNNKMLNKTDDLTKSVKNALKEVLEKQKKVNDLKEKEAKVEEKLNEFDNSTIRVAKAELGLLQAKYVIDKKSLDLSNSKKAIDKIKLKNIKDEKELQEAINELQESGIELDDTAIKNKKDLIKFADKSYAINKKSLKLNKEQTKELGKQVEAIKKEANTKKGLLKKLWSGSGDEGGGLKGKALKGLGTLFAADKLVSSAKNLYDIHKKIIRQYNSIGNHLGEAGSRTGSLISDTFAYSYNLRKVQVTAERFGLNMDDAAGYMDVLASKVKFITKEGLAIEKLAETTNALIGFSSSMGIGFEEAASFYEMGMHKFRKATDSFESKNKDVLAEMNSLKNAVGFFNDTLQDGGLFANEFVQTIAEARQNTKYWAQDTQFLNTQFLRNVNILMTQGKSQKQALDLANKMNNSLQQPNELVKWKAGSSLARDVKALIKGKSKKEALEAIKKEYGNVDENAIYSAVKENNNSGFTQANILQELMGGTRAGTKSTVSAWKSFMGLDSAVLQNMGLGESVSEADQLKSLYKEMSAKEYASDTFESALTKIYEKQGKTPEQIKDALSKFDKASANSQMSEPEYKSKVVDILGQILSVLNNDIVGGVLGGIGTVVGAKKYLSSGKKGDATKEAKEGAKEKKEGAKKSKSKGKENKLQEDLTKGKAPAQPESMTEAMYKRGVDDATLKKMGIDKKALAEYDRLNKVSRKSIRGEAIKGNSLKAKNLARLGKGSAISAIAGVGLGIAEQKASESGHTNVAEAAHDAGGVLGGIGVATPVGAVLTGLSGGVMNSIQNSNGNISDSATKFATGAVYGLTDACVGFADGTIGALVRLSGAIDDETEAFHFSIGAMSDWNDAIDFIQEGTQKASVTDEAKARLDKIGGHENDESKLVDLGNGISQQDMQRKLVGEGDKESLKVFRYYQKQENRKKVRDDLQAKFGGKVTEEDVNAEIARRGEEASKNAIETQKKQDEQTKILELQQKTARKSGTYLQTMASYDLQKQALSFTNKEGVFEGLDEKQKIMTARSIKLQADASGTVLLGGAGNYVSEVAAKTMSQS